MNDWIIFLVGCYATLLCAGRYGDLALRSQDRPPGLRIVSFHFVARDDQVGTTHPNQENAGMLILSRKSGERIRIAEDVEIVVQSIQGSRRPHRYRRPADYSSLTRRTTAGWSGGGESTDSRHRRR